MRVICLGERIEKELHLLILVFFMPRFATVRIVVNGPYGSIKCKGMIRYCRPADGGYRVGLQIEFEDRLANAMWMRLLNRASSGIEYAA